MMDTCIRIFSDGISTGIGVGVGMAWLYDLERMGRAGLGIEIMEFGVLTRTRSKKVQINRKGRTQLLPTNQRSNIQIK